MRVTYICPLPLLVAAASVRAASPTQDAHAVCQQLHDQIPSRVAFGVPENKPTSTNSIGSLTADYIEATTRYHNKANADDVPACILFPSCAEDVSAAMKLLANAPRVPFALKSGGHDWNRGFSSTDGGVLISFRPNLNYTVLNEDGESADVGPGARWEEVINVLDPKNKTVVGGRYGDVGVGGYVPKGGMSHLTAQYGFASDNVISFEVVLADGQIAHASRHSHPDLFWALRGGGNLFAVITKLTLQTHPIGTIWGGDRSYSADKTPAVLRATTRYTSRYNDTKAALTPSFIQAGPLANNTGSWSVTFFYDGSEPPAHIFADFNAIEALSDDTGPKRYTALMNTSGTPNFSFRVVDSVSSFPNLPEDEMADFALRHWNRMMNASFVLDSNIKFQFLNMAWQPIPVALQRSNFDRGPAPLTTNPSDGDKMWIENALAWDDPVCDFTCPQMLRATVDQGKFAMQEEYAGIKPTNWKAGDVAEVGFKPLFANDAMWGQDVYESYGDESYARLKEVQRRYDPKGVFFSQTKGFKL